MATTLTNRYLDTLPPDEKPYERADAKIHGLLIRVERGRKTFVYRWARGKRATIGPYPTVT